MSEQSNDNIENIGIRFQLARERISSLKENTEASGYRDYILTQAEFIVNALSVYDELKDGVYGTLSLEELKNRNKMLYRDLADGNYSRSYCDPDVACAQFGTETGRILSALSVEIRNLCGHIFENRLWDITVTMELFLEFVYAFESLEKTEDKYLLKILYSHFYDYCPEITKRRISDIVTPCSGRVYDTVMNADLCDLRYLYMYGEYISDEQIRTAEFINSLSEDDVKSIASVYTEGYRQGFIAARKDISRKKTVNIRFQGGFERIVREAAAMFRQMGLYPVIYRSPGGLMHRRGIRIGFFGGIASRQCDYDHRYDEMLILDEKYVSRRLSCMREAFEEQKEAANVHGGPAVIETFGEKEFVPVPKKTAVSPSDELMALKLRFDSEAAMITNRYIISSERSFTIIAFPVPGIGKDFEAVFRDTMKINMLDSEKYRRIQQNIIDVLDKASEVRIKGAAGNATDLTIKLHELTDPSAQTNFENCTADVNIPVGEVFTSPLLKGTSGILHVSKVYLNGLLFRDLKLEIKDGMIAGYSCKGQKGDEDGKKYIEDNILFGHKSLPMGEFAIGTNTEAFVFGAKYAIEDRLPILIAEKTGPHFAFGDTCYSFEEEVRVYNPDGKEIIAKDNECSIKRKEDPASAYFNCHTDITIPYNEIEYIRAADSEGREYGIIEKGRYAVEGTGELNAPLDIFFESFVKK